MRIVFASVCIADDLLKYNSKVFPIGLRNLSTIAKNHGMDSILFDVNKFIRQYNPALDNFVDMVTENILSYKPDYLGFYTRLDILPHVLEIANCIHKKNDEIPIILGGPGVFGIERLILEKFDEIDIVICGEGEVTFNELFLNGRLSENLTKINGLYFRNKDGKIVETGYRPPVLCLDELPFPDGDDKLVDIEAGRGCPYSCSFCTTSKFWQRKYRVKSPSRIVKEMDRLNYLYGTTSFDLIHDNLAVSEEFINQFVYELNKKGNPYQWTCSARIDNVNEDIIKKIAGSGCIKIFFGIETGSDKMQKLIGKNINTNVIYRNLEFCDKYKLKSIKSFILGFYEEDIEDINKTLEVAIRSGNYVYNDTVQLYYLMPTPGIDITNNHFDKLVTPPSYINFLNNKRYIDMVSYYQSEIIKNNNELFSSFYVLPYMLEDINKYEVAFCFTHLLLFYIRSLNIILNHGVRPIEVYKLIKQSCKDCEHCIKNAVMSTQGGCGYCKNILELANCFFNPSKLEKSIMNYESEKRNAIIEKQIEHYHSDYYLKQ